MSTPDGEPTIPEEDAQPSTPVAPAIPAPTSTDTPKGKVWYFFNTARNGMVHGRIPTEEEITQYGFAKVAFDQHMLLQVAIAEPSKKPIVLCDENGNLILSMEELRG